MHKLGLTIALAIASAWLASACGGASSSDADFSDPKMPGMGGSKSTTGGAQGGEAGEPASNGPLGGKGSNTSGTTGLSDGGETNGETTGGAASEPVRPDPKVREGCQDWCDGVVSAACDATKVEDCLFGCRAVASSAPCNARYAELFACAKDATFSCNKDGDAVPEGCELKYAQTALCVLSSPDESLAKPCQTYCDKQAAAACTNSTPAAECAYGCQVQGALVPTCEADWKTFVACAKDAEVTCNTSGDAVPEACVAPYLLYLACVVKAGQ